MSRFEWLETSAEIDEPDGEEGPGEECPDEEHFLKLGDDACAAGSYEKALRYYSRVLNMNRRVQRAWVGQLLCLFDLGEYNETITWADKALEMFPDSAEILAIKSVTWGRLGQYEKARGFSDSALKTGEQSSLVWWCRGDVLMADNPKNAEFCFRKAMEVDRRDWGLFLKIGKTFLTVGKPLQAREVLLTARNAAQDQPLIWHWLGVANEQAGFRAEAEQCYLRAVELRPGESEYRDALDGLRRQSPMVSMARRLKRWFKGEQ